MEIKSNGMERRAFLKGPAAVAAGLAAGQFARASETESITGESAICYRDQGVYRIIGAITRKQLSVGKNASKVIQEVLDSFVRTGGGKLTLEPGLYHLDEPLRIHSSSKMQGGGACTVLRVTPENKDGMGILCERGQRVSINDLCVDGNLWSNNAATVGIVIDQSSEVTVSGVRCENFNRYGLQLTNRSSLCHLTNCSASNNLEANYMLEDMSLPKEGYNVAPIGDFIPNLVSNCYAVGGGNGFKLSRALCQNIVGCVVFQAGKAAYYVTNGSNSTLISGCRSFQGLNQGAQIENSSEINVSSSIFCWHKGHGIEVSNCTWGTISANEFIDNGASSRVGGKYGIYLHTDVKSLQVTGNAVWNWPHMEPLAVGIMEDETCRNNNIVGNSINEFTEAGVSSKGTNSATADNLAWDKPYPKPSSHPFSKSITTAPLTPVFDRVRLEQYFKSQQVEDAKP